VHVCVCVLRVSNKSLLWL